ncbi:MAG TPA: porin family protein [Bacteroidales bacterium]
MKTFGIIVLMLFFIIPGISFAQRFHGGPLLGFNASQVDGDTYSGYNRFGLMGGTYVYTHLTDVLDIQMEIKYMSKGARKLTTEQDPTQYKSNLNYIEIPVLLRYNTKQKIGIEAGLGFGYLFSYSEEDENGILPSRATTKFKPFELSSLIGMNYQFAKKFSVNLRYSYSILSIVNRPTVNYTYFRHSGVFNNLFSLGLYYTLGK